MTEPTDAPEPTEPTEPTEEGALEIPLAQDPRISESARKDLFHRAFLEAVTSPVMGDIVEAVIAQTSKRNVEGTLDTKLKLGMSMIWFVRTMLRQMNVSEEIVIQLMTDTVLVGAHLMEAGVLQVDEPKKIEEPRIILP